MGALASGCHRLPQLALARQPEPIGLGVVDGAQVSVEIVRPLTPDLNDAIAVAQGRDATTEVVLASDVPSRHEIGSLRDGE